MGMWEALDKSVGIFLNSKVWIFPLLKTLIGQDNLVGRSTWLSPKNNTINRKQATTTHGEDPNFLIQR